MGNWLVVAAMAMSSVAAGPFSLEKADAGRWLSVLGVASGAGRSHTRERLLVLNAAGRVVRVVEGGEGQVELPADVDQILSRPEANLTLIHNHPAGNGLSADDLSQLEKAGVAMVVAIGHDGSLYAAARGPRFPAEGLARFEDATYGRARARAERVLRGERDVANRRAFAQHVHHILAEGLHLAQVLDYRAVLGADRLNTFNNARPFLARVRDAATAAVRR